MWKSLKNQRKVGWLTKLEWLQCAAMRAALHTWCRIRPASWHNQLLRSEKFKVHQGRGNYNFIPRCYVLRKKARENLLHCFTFLKVDIENACRGKKRICFFVVSGLFFSLCATTNSCARKPALLSYITKQMGTFFCVLISAKEDST